MGFCFRSSVSQNVDIRAFLQPAIHALDLENFRELCDEPSCEFCVVFVVKFETFVCCSIQ